MYRYLKRIGLTRKAVPNPKYIPKPYQEALFPGEKVQIDVKVVPIACIMRQAQARGEKMYQYTAIDECTRMRYWEAFQEQSTYSSTVFLQHLVRRFSFPICRIQTDNGFEFTNRFGRSKTAKLTLFERQLAAYHIIH
ncbi:MAG: DDE-type integrase/transposase/recombinase [Megasphaera sp.]|nr:DDE-type integrase/transposase/recombinase [Megasphaera sp.]